MSDTQLTAKQQAQLQRNVVRGVKFLDKKDNGWWNGESKSEPIIHGMIGHIDLAVLNLADPNVCVLGQRMRIGYEHGNYDVAVSALGLCQRPSDTDHYAGLRRQFLHGFDLDDDFGREPGFFSYLTELWVAVISARRDAKSQNNQLPFVRLANKEWKRPRR